MDPITFSAAVLTAFAPTTLVGTIIGGWLGNRSDHYLCKTYDIVQNRLRNPSEPTNHDIQRAVRGAYLKATLVICQRLIARESNVVQRFLLFPTVDIARVVGYLKKQLTQLPDAKFDIPTNAATAHYETLLQPRGETSGERTAELTQQLRTALLDELAAAGLHVEDDLKAAILTGLADQGQRVDWYELVCAFFAEELKANSRLSTITETNLLLELKALMLDLKTDMPDITWPDGLLDQQTERLGKAMEPVVAQFYQLMTRLDEMLVVLVRMESKLDRVQETVEAGNAQLLDALSQLHPQPPARSKYLNAFARYDSDRLIGRVTELAEIDSRLTRQKMLLVRGMGGIGKTTLAKAYLDRAHDVYSHLAYVDIAGTIADSMLRELGNADAVSFTANPDHTTDEKFAALLDTLRGIPNLLLVLDNIRDADAAADLRTRKAALESLDATVLITGRVRQAEFVQANQLMELGSLAPTDARILFERSLGRPVRPAETALVNDILKKAFYHAKLIEVVATQISRNVFMSLAEARDMVANRQFDDEELNFPDGLDAQAQTIYRILLDLFNTDPLSEDLKQLLRYFAVLPAIDIPIDHLTALLGTETTDRRTLGTNLLQLSQTAWLDQLDTRYFSMHGLVQWVVRERLQPALENCATLINGTVQLLYDKLKTNPLDTQPYLVYGDELLTVFQEDQNGPLTTLYSNIAVSYGALGENQKRLDYDLKALGIREQTLSPTHPDLATSYANIAVSYGALGENQKRLDYDLKALGIREQTLSPTHPELATSYANIAVSYGVLGENQKQLDYNLKALGIREQTLSPTHPELAMSYANIAGSYGALGENQKRLDYDLKALGIREQTLSPTHPDLAVSYNNIAVSYGALGENQKQLDYNLKALGIREQTLSPTHPDLAVSYNNIAVSYGALGENQKRLDYNLKALGIREQTLSPTHPELATSYANIAVSYGVLGENQKQLDYNLKALGIREQTLSPTHPDLAVSYNNIAVSYGALGENQKRLDYDLKALGIREQTLSPTHPDLARSYANIAVSYGALGENQKRLDYDLKALGIREQTLSPTHPDLARSYANIAVSYGALGENQKQLDYDLKALGIREQTLSPTHPDLAMSYANIAVSYGALGENQKRLDYDLKALGIREQTLSPTHPDLAVSYNNIAITYYYVGDLAKALGYMQKAVAIRERVLPPQHPDVLSSQQSLAFLEQAVREQEEGNDL